MMGAMLGSVRTAIALLCWTILSGVQAPASSVTYEAFAVRFGILPAFQVSGLVAGAERSRTLDIPVMVWLLKGSNGRTVLIDSGFYRQKFLDQWHPRDFRTPAAAVESAGVKADAITDVIISHAHWDRAWDRSHPLASRYACHVTYSREIAENAEILCLLKTNLCDLCALREYVA